MRLLSLFVIVFNFYFNQNKVKYNYYFLSYKIKMEFLTKIDKSKTLLEYFKLIKKDAIFNLFSDRIFYKGLDYYNKKYITDCYFNSKNILEATVSGTDIYKVKLSLENNEIKVSCSCPYDSICKHIAGTFFELSELAKTDQFPEININRMNTMDEKEFFDKYLQNLSKNELITLLHEIAPDNYKKKIISKYLSSNETGKILLDSETRIKKFFNSKNNLSWESIDEKVIDLLTELEPFFEVKHEHVYKIIRFIVNEIEEITNDGGLNDSDYYDYDDEGFDFDNLDKMIYKFLMSVKTEKKLLYFYEIISECEYTSILTLVEDDLEKFFREEEQKPFLDYLFKLKRISEKLYTFFSNIMTEEQKENLLLKHTNNDFCNQTLISFYESKKEYEKLINFLESKILENHRIKPFLFKRIELASKFNDNTVIWIDKLAQENLNSNEMNSFFEYISVEKTFYYENIFKQKQTYVFIEYLEMKNRFGEALDLAKNAKIYSSEKHSFFARNKSKFPQDSLVFFSEYLEQNLIEAKERSYKDVITTLSHIKDIETKEKFRDLIYDLKIKYKRRPKLIEMITDRF